MESRASPGDGGPATSASLSLTIPSGITVDSAGNLYIADTGNSRVRQVSAGTITTIAGNGGIGYSGDGGPAASATLFSPLGVAVDSAGNLYIADTNNARIRMVAGGTITTVAGIGTNGFSGDGGSATSASISLPFGIAVDTLGSLYITDYLNGRIRKVSGGTITTIVGTGNPGFSGDGGPATSAQLSNPQGLAVDASGNIYIADRTNERIRKVSGGTITTVAGTGKLGFYGDGGPASSATLDPGGVAVDSNGNVYVADTDNNRLRKLSGGTLTTVAGNGAFQFSGDGGPASSASLQLPTATAVDSAGNVYIADTANNRIRKVSGGIITTIAGNGNQGFSGDGGPATSASLYLPNGVAVDSGNNIYISDSYNARIRKVSGGTITTVSANGGRPYGVAVDSKGSVYFSDFDANQIRKLSGGVIMTIAGNGSRGYSGDGGPATGASLNAPQGLAVDSSGNVFIADVGNHRVRKISDGIITTVAGGGNSSGDGVPALSANLSFAAGVAVDSAGNLYISDSLRGIRKVVGRYYYDYRGEWKSRILR